MSETKAPETAPKRIYVPDSFTEEEADQLSKRYEEDTVEYIRADVVERLVQIAVERNNQLWLKDLSDQADSYYN